ncbi:MAG: DUF3108 domain-containing protein [Deltaproteobacteria bacterium]|nr:DUF3108 domain-containing protein [Deltaproteobacteria bacterium]MBW2018267.1 DUF3108 domain-containing protein [Deltaproteobacteria bacterium]MBW2130845.1 DUF3108 domain-containing protein [Deltaproteobacteria bacterium]MBW2305267.1 DUF3108 domain-containing protein [Deltaproteobacteria bacterium]
MKSFLPISIILPALLLFLPPVFGADAASIKKNVPFSVGERLTFQVKWAFIPAGEAVLEVLPLENVSGIQARHFVLTARTYPFFDLIYKVRRRIDGYTDMQMKRSLLYRKRKMGEGCEEIIVRFDWEKGVAWYSRLGTPGDAVALLSGTLDPLSVFYAFRFRNLKENTSLRSPVSDGKRCVIGAARVIRREKIRGVLGSFDTFLVEPEVKKIGGIFKKSRKARLQVWITADEKRIPVRVKTRVAVGSFVAELVSYERGVGQTSVQVSEAPIDPASPEPFSYRLYPSMSEPAARVRSVSRGVSLWRAR